MTLAHATTESREARLPQVAGIRKVILEVWIVPFGVYPDPDADALDQKIRADVSALLTQAGFEVLPEYSDVEEAPALKFDISSAMDQTCPGKFAVHANARFLDFVTVRRPGVGRVRAQAELWRLERHGDTFLLSRDDGQAILAKWAHDAAVAFIDAVASAANKALEPRLHE